MDYASPCPWLLVPTFLERNSQYMSMWYLWPKVYIFLKMLLNLSSLTPSHASPRAIVINGSIDGLSWLIYLSNNHYLCYQTIFFNFKGLYGLLLYHDNRCKRYVVQRHNLHLILYKKEKLCFEKMHCFVNIKVINIIQ